DDGADAALLLQRQHLADDRQRFLPGRLDEAAGVDDHHVGAVGVRRQDVAVLGQLAEHALGVDGVLRTTQAYPGERAFGGSLHLHSALEIRLLLRPLGTIFSFYRPHPGLSGGLAPFRRRARKVAPWDWRLSLFFPGRGRYTSGRGRAVSPSMIRELF